MGRFPRTILIILALVIFNPLPAQWSAEGVVSDLKSATVTVITYDEDGGALTRGCGFFTGEDGHLVTNRHVIEGSHHAEVRFPDGQSYAVEGVIAEDVEADLIKLSVDVPAQSLKVFPVAPLPAKVGERIVVIGPQKGARDSSREVLTGNIAAVRNIGGFGTIIEMSAAVSAGFSGSPVVNMKGEVVGITTFQVLRKGEFNFAVPASRLENLIPKPGKEIQKWEQERRFKSNGSNEELYLDGVHLLWCKDWKAALVCLDEVVEDNPLYVVAYPLIAYCNMELERWQEAIDAYYQSLLINPSDGWAYHNIAVCYGKLERWGEAMAAYRQAIRLAPDNVHSYCGLGMAYVKIGSWEDASVNFRKAVQLDPGFSEAHYGLGLSYWVADDMDAAWRQYHILKKLDERLADDLLGYLKE